MARCPTGFDNGPRPTRRQFIAAGAAAGIAAAGVAVSAAPLLAPEAGEVRGPRTLVLVQLDGGNDAWNTIVPWGDAMYASARPTLALRRRDTIDVGWCGVRLHAALAPLRLVIRAGQLAAIAGVRAGDGGEGGGHFDCERAWHRLGPEDSTQRSGWIARACDRIDGSVHFWSLDRSVPMAFCDARLWAVRPVFGPRSDLSDASLATRLEFVAARVVDARSRPGEPTPEFLQIFFLRHRGFDTHENQLRRHASRLSELASATARFQARLAALGANKSVLTVIYSETGRSLQENESGGTDHGPSGCVLLLGGRVRGGLYGSPEPSAGDRDRIDYRRIWSSIAVDWLGVPPGSAVSARWQSQSMAEVVASAAKDC